MEENNLEQDSWLNYSLHYIYIILLISIVLILFLLKQEEGIQSFGMAFREWIALTPLILIPLITVKSRISTRWILFGISVFIYFILIILLVRYVDTEGLVALLYIIVMAIVMPVSHYLLIFLKKINNITKIALIIISIIIATYTIIFALAEASQAQKIVENINIEAEIKCKNAYGELTADQFKEKCNKIWPIDQYWAEQKEYCLEGYENFKLDQNYYDKHFIYPGNYRTYCNKKTSLINWHIETPTSNNWKMIPPEIKDPLVCDRLSTYLKNDSYLIEDRDCYTRAALGRGEIEICYKAPHKIGCISTVTLLKNPTLCESLSELNEEDYYLCLALSYNDRSYCNNITNQIQRDQCYRLVTDSV